MTKLEWTLVMLTLLLAILVGVVIGVSGLAPFRSTTSYLPSIRILAAMHVEQKVPVL